MNDERTGGAFRGGDFVLVGPATVVRHRFPLEHRAVEFRAVVRIGHGRITDQHDEDFALYIHVLVVVPSVLWGIDAVAHEHHLGVHVDHRHLVTCTRDVIGGERQRNHARTDAERCFRFADDAGEGGVLHERAVGHAALEPHRSELRLEVGDGFVFAWRGWRAAFERVVAEGFGMGHQAIGGDGGEGRREHGVDVGRARRTRGGVTRAAGRERRQGGGQSQSDGARGPRQAARPRK